MTFKLRHIWFLFCIYSCNESLSDESLKIQVSKIVNNIETEISTGELRFSLGCGDTSSSTTFIDDSDKTIKSESFEFIENGLFESEQYFFDDEIIKVTFAYRKDTVNSLFEESIYMLEGYRYREILKGQEFILPKPLQKRMEEVLNNNFQL